MHVKERHVVLVGSCGVENAGNDAALLAFTDGLRRLAPDVHFRFTLFSRHPDPELAERVQATLRPSLEYQSREAAAGKWFRGFNPGDDRSELRGIEEAVRQADLVLALGDDLLVEDDLDLFRGPLSLVATFAFLADLQRTPFQLCSVGAGPLYTKSARSLCDWIVRRSHAVTLGDEASLACLQGLSPESSLRAFPRLPFALEPSSDVDFERALEREGIPAASDRPRLAVALRDAEIQGVARDSWIEALRTLGERFELLFVSQCTHHEQDDVTLAQGWIDLLGRSDAHLVRRRHTPDVHRRFYETADVALTLRLHGAVFSALSGVPCVGITRRPRVQGVFEALGEGAICLESTADASSIVAAVDALRGQDGARLQARALELAATSRGHLAVALESLGIDRAADAA